MDVKFVEGGSHALFYDFPDEFSETLLAFCGTSCRASLEVKQPTAGRAHIPSPARTRAAEVALLSPPRHPLHTGACCFSYVLQISFACKDGDSFRIIISITAITSKT
ncbi:hypothetical protein A0H81_10613 [Grifola frondosa]|uniref:Uncharacterized protein n=1 Tax=Grifola frondosa TaxID=5627 RepID=A0A1C7M2S0_GRIFR|nr:hypothetical protein A0H81_10613 [Grifola frondosa]